MDHTLIIYLFGTDSGGNAVNAQDTNDARNPEYLSVFPQSHFRLNEKIARKNWNFDRFFPVFAPAWRILKRRENVD